VFPSEAAAYAFLASLISKQIRSVESELIALRKRLAWIEHAAEVERFAVTAGTARRKEGA
jgi:hypothetical protein